MMAPGFSTQAIIAKLDLGPYSSKAVLLTFEILSRPEPDGFCCVHTIRGSSKHPSRCLNEPDHLGLICSFHASRAGVADSLTARIRWLLEDDVQ